MYYCPLHFQKVSISERLVILLVIVTKIQWLSPSIYMHADPASRAKKAQEDILFKILVNTAPSCRRSNHHHHHHVVPPARISQTLSHHFSQSFIALGRSSGLHPVSSHSWCMYVRAGRPAFAWQYAGVHRSTSLMSSSLLLQQCPACLVRLTCIVFVLGGEWPYSWCLVGCCCQDLFNIALNILV